jgi:hypothetical protein
VDVRLGSHSISHADLPREYRNCSPRNVVPSLPARHDAAMTRKEAIRWGFVWLVLALGFLAVSLTDLGGIDAVAAPVMGGLALLLSLLMLVSAQRRPE